MHSGRSKASELLHAAAVSVISSRYEVDKGSHSQGCGTWQPAIKGPTPTLWNLPSTDPGAPHGFTQKPTSCFASQHQSCVLHSLQALLISQFGYPTPDQRAQHAATMTAAAAGKHKEKVFVKEEALNSGTSARQRESPCDAAEVANGAVRARQRLGSISWGTTGLDWLQL